jgi:2'-5' RNA ligase
VDPLIVDLLLVPEVQRRFDDLRGAHFPPERLVVGAHVTLFHALPGERLEQVREDLARAADRPAFPVRVAGVVLLGRGVAFALRSEELAALHRDLQRTWEPELTPQDRQRLSAHVTVQNKVPPERARALHGDLTSGFAPYDVPAVGLGLWRYAGGPWEPLARFPFADAA